MDSAITAEAAQRAWQEWGCNCGPAALAAVLRLTLDQVRPHMIGFEAKRYTSPTMMWAALRSAGARFSYRGGNLGHDGWPLYGLARIQWGGAWLKPGVPPAAAYGRTHWIGVNARNRDDIGIFDVNATSNGSGWCPLADWIEFIVPHILAECIPRHDGTWFITHAVEVADG